MVAHLTILPGSLQTPLEHLEPLAHNRDRIIIEYLKAYFVLRNWAHRNPYYIFISFSPFHQSLCSDGNQPLMLLKVAIKDSKYL